MGWLYKAIEADEGYTIVEDFGDMGHTGAITVYSETKEGLLEVLQMMWDDVYRQIAEDAEIRGGILRISCPICRMKPPQHKLGCQNAQYVGQQLRQLQQENDALVEAARWIPVGERLPKPWDFVLVWVEYESGTPYHTIDRYDDGDDNGPLWEESTSTYMRVTHWMPLPNPPKENDSD